MSQLIRYARACSSYAFYIVRAARLSCKLLGQGYFMGRLKSSLRKFYGRYGDLIKSLPLPNVTCHSGTCPYTTTIERNYTNLRTYYRAGPYYRSWSPGSPTKTFIRWASPGVLYKLRNINAIGRRSWNITSQEQKVMMWKLKSSRLS